MFSVRAIGLSAVIAVAMPFSAQTVARHRQPSPSPKASRASAASAQEFSARVNAYIETRNRTAGAPAQPTKSAKKITETSEQLRARTQQERANAKQGDIFTPRVAEYFHHQLADAFRGRAGARVLASLRNAEPVKGRVQVNQAYPEDIPRQSMPPSLLLRLPKLPKELEYRIVGRDLVLLDTAPNLVVDILPNAVPQP
jgi:hypothetical protein